MYKTFICAFIILSFLSCKKEKTVSSENKNLLLLSKAKSYVGTPYKYGGTDVKGMDCSGLIFVAFKDLNLSIPRMSDKQADFFKEIRLEDVEPGDLIYFKVGTKKIDHTGIVSKIVKRDEIYFLHASTTKGVREDNLFSKYWHSKFIKITRPVF